MKNTSVQTSFTASDTIQLRLELGKVVDAVQTPLADADLPPGATPNPNTGWVWQGDGYIGRVGGRDNDIFMPTDELAQSDIADLFDPSDTDGVIQAKADKLSKWSVLVNGEAVAIEAVSRKSHILETAEVGWFDFDFSSIENVFLKLAEPLTQDDEVSIRFADPDFDMVEAVFQPEDVISEAVHVNLRGFDPDDGVKVAYLSSWNGWKVDPALEADGEAMQAIYRPGMRFQVVDNATGETVKTGEIELSKGLDEPSNFSLNFQGTDVWKLDFSDVTAEGTYHVVVDEVGRSQSFEITDSHWFDIYDVSFSGFYHQRSGIALDAEYTEFERPRSLHPDDGIEVLQTTVKISDTSEGYRNDRPGPFDLFADATTGEIVEGAWGGWHDAGDWDRRTQHHEAARKLIELVELAPEFAERAANIPENTNALPDLLDEALWSLELFRRLQSEDGGVSGGIESESHPKFGEGSWDESQKVYAYAPDVWSTLEYAASAAKMASILQDYDPSAVAGWRESAIAAMEWAEANLPVGDDYDNTINTSRNLAAVELYHLTDDARWHQLYKQTNVYKTDDVQIDWNAHQYEAAFVYARMDASKTNALLAQNARQALLDEGEYLMADGDRSGFGFTINPYAPYGWGNTGQQANFSADFFARVHALTGEKRWLDAIESDLQYALGANPQNMSFVTGLGDIRTAGELLNADAEVLGYGPVPGITLYGDYNIRDYGYNFYHGIMDDAVWPNFYDVPVAESYNGFSIFVPSAEYTVQQGITDTTFLTGYLAAQQAGEGAKPVEDDQPTDPTPPPPVEPDPIEDDQPTDPTPPSPVEPDPVEDDQPTDPTPPSPVEPDPVEDDQPTDPTPPPPVEPDPLTDPEPPVIPDPPAEPDPVTPVEEPDTDIDPVGAAQLGEITIRQGNKDLWTRVDFDAPIDDAVVVMGAPTSNGWQPLNLRVRNVDETGFEVQIDEWDYLNGKHGKETMSWMALSEGSYTLADGRQVSAGTTRLKTKEKTVDLDGFDAAPIVIAQVMSERGRQSVTDRIVDVRDDGFDFRLQEEQAADDRHIKEDVGWVAIEAGAGDTLDVQLVERLTHREKTVALDKADDAFIFADMQTMRGKDVATVRMAGADGEAVRLYLQEEQSADQEMGHMAEEVGLIAFSEEVIELFA